MSFTDKSSVLDLFTLTNFFYKKEQVIQFDARECRFP